MVKIYTKVTFEWNATASTYQATNDAEFYEYDGNLAYCGGSSGGGGSDSSTTTSTAPWSEQIPYLTQGFQQAQNLFINNTPQYYPGQQTAPFSPETNTALQLGALRSTQGNPLNPLSQIQDMATLGGAYLPNNPFTQTLDQQFTDPTNDARFNQAVTSAQNKIIPAIDSQFEGSGRLNSGLANTAKTQAVSDAFANMYMQDKSLTAQDRALQGQNYTNERNNMMGATLAAPGLANQDYTDISALANVGSTQDAMNQSLLNNNVNQFNYNQNIRQQQLQQFMQLVGGNFGSTSTTNGATQAIQPGTNVASAGLGGALAGYKLAGGIAGLNPYVGAGLGLLSSFNF